MRYRTGRVAGILRQGLLQAAALAAALMLVPMTVHASTADYIPRYLDIRTPEHLRGVPIDREQRDCLAQALYHEARGETELGRIAVAQVILNRVRARVYPDTICGVVYENRHMKNRCQFSFACDGISDRPREARSWRSAVRLANGILCIGGCARRAASPEIERLTQGLKSATHYHATYVSPRWARAKKRVGHIGLHIFYRSERVARTMPASY
jgi:N-acetylmuramoyl-L-alanine amidase